MTRTLVSEVSSGAISSWEKNSVESDYEVSLLRLLERVTNGTVIEISVTGASCRALHT